MSELFKMFAGMNEALAKIERKKEEDRERSQELREKFAERASDYWLEKMEDMDPECQDVNEAVKEAKEWSDHQEDLQRFFDGKR